MTEGTEIRSLEPRALSLDLELSTLASATRGAEILADYQTRQGFMDEASEEDAPVCVFSILSLVRGRIEQLRRVVRGEEDPGHMWGPHNAITLPESLADVDGDIVLFPWNARGMPLVLARPSGWGLDEKEIEERQAMGLEGLKTKEPQGPKGRKAQNSEGRKSKDREGRKVKEPKEQAPEPPSVQGEAPKETPPVAPGPTPKRAKEGTHRADLPRHPARMTPAVGSPPVRVPCSCGCSYERQRRPELMVFDPHQFRLSA